MKTTNKAFTLIELLVVVGIIAILMALLLPVINSAKVQARKTRARAEIKQMETAWKSLLMDCRTWPVGQMAVSPYFSNLESIDKMRVPLVFCLGGNNPRGIRYLEIRTNDLFFASGGNLDEGGLKDPWGRIYRIKFDHDYDNNIAVTRGGGVRRTNEMVSRSVAIWSEGPGTDINDPTDDLLGW